MKKIFILLVFLGSIISIGFCDEPKPDTIQSGPIHQLVDRLSKRYGLWTNGLFPPLELPSTATIEQVVSKVFEINSFDQGQVSSYKILQIEEVEIDSQRYTAVRVETDFDEKIILLRYENEKIGWWSRVFDANTIKEEKK